MGIILFKEVVSRLFISHLLFTALSRTVTNRIACKKSGEPGTALEEEAASFISSIKVQLSISPHNHLNSRDVS